MAVTVMVRTSAGSRLLAAAAAPGSVSASAPDRLPDSAPLSALVPASDSGSASGSVVLACTAVSSDSPALEPASAPVFASAGSGSGSVAEAATAVADVSSPSEPDSDRAEPGVCWTGRVTGSSL
ncbi:hypothetical protein WKI71_39860 [Streptomyces sp. MS1.AVA.1]|uniref:Secreted protein n=1 Tax=Streptomyces machairae TaxID=3134109 RepID=A0ABU8UTQ9_9ACTN